MTTCVDEFHGSLIFHLVTSIAGSLDDVSRDRCVEWTVCLIFVVSITSHWLQLLNSLHPF